MKNFSIKYILIMILTLSALHLQAETVKLSNPEIALVSSSEISANLAGKAGTLATGYVATWTWTGPEIIMDNDSSWLTIVCDPNDLIDPGFAVTSVEIYHSISHSYIGDLDVQVLNQEHYWDLYIADGYDNSDDIYETLTDSTAFFGDDPAQIWYYQVRDLYAGDTGTLNEIKLSVYYLGATPDISLNVSQLEIDCSSEQTSVTSNAEIASASLTDDDCQIIDSDEIESMFQKDGTANVIVNLKKSLVAEAAKGIVNGKINSQYRSKVKEVRSAILDKLESQKGFKARYEYDNMPAFSATLTKDQFSELMASGKVASIEPVKKYRCLTAQGLPLINAFDSRDANSGGGVSIAICDTGLDYNHPMLGGGGFPNDKVIGGYDFGDGDSDPMPYAEAHGTACAGIAAGFIGSYGDYVGGVAPGAKLYALKVTVGSDEYMYDDAIASSWDWCVTNQYADPENPILVISVSLGSESFSSICDGNTTVLTNAAQNAASAGITIVAASGNEGYCNAIAEPSCISNIISVGATYDKSISAGWCVEPDSCVRESEASCDSGYLCTDQGATAGEVSCYSNSAAILDLLAPSYAVTTTDISGSGGYSTDDYVTGFAGTSAATPYAAGSVAVIQQAAYLATGSYLSPEEVRNTLVYTGSLVYDPKSDLYTPLIDLASAIESIKPCDGTLLEISNAGTGILTISGISLPSWISSDQEFPVEIAPAASIKICLASDCSSVCANGITYSDSITINSDDPDTPAFVLPVVATCASCEKQLKGDITGDCLVNINDVAELAIDWLECGYVPVTFCN